VARTDALAVAGMDEAVARVVAARKAGADASFVEAPASIEELAQIGERCPAPNVANMIQGGKTPVLKKQRLEELGFHLILHPLCSLFAAAGAMRQVCRKLHRDGDTFDLTTPMTSFGEFNELIGVEEKIALAERFEGKP
jgi:2-methylisocitrate lyase-like PEP mutase family enzyme